MILAHIADAHLGYSQYKLRERKLDFFRAFEYAFLESNKLADVIVIAGDLFNTINVDIETLNFVKGLFQQTKKHVILIPGNHDKVSKTLGYSPVDLFSSLPKIHVFTGMPYIVNFKEYKFYLSTSQNYSELIDLINMVDTPLEQSFLVFHGIIKGFKESFFNIFNFNPEIPNVEIFKNKFNYVFLGDIHMSVDLTIGETIVAYSGSTEYNSKTEVKFGPRSFNLFDTNNRQLSKITIPTRPAIHLSGFYDVAKIPEKSLVYIDFNNDEEYNIFMENDFNNLKDRVLYLSVSNRSFMDSVSHVETFQLSEIIDNLDVESHIKDIIRKIIDADIETYSVSDAISFIENIVEEKITKKEMEV